MEFFNFQPAKKTAAHCQFSTFHDVVVSKTTFRAFPHPDEKIIRGIKVIDHPEAKVTPFGTWDFDFELVKLAKKIHFDGKLSPICLPSPDADFSGEKCWLAGWGRTQATPKKYAEKLQEVKTRGTKSDLVSLSNLEIKIFYIIFYRIFYRLFYI